jgi:DNA polymerase I-like protein with 3'-5' exonuclease and polymerase domains
MYKYIELDELLPSIKTGQPLAFDTETKTKYGKICLAQFYQEHWDEVLMIKNPDPIMLMAYLAQLEDTPLIMQKANYDITTIQRQTGSRFVPHLFEDTLLLARIAWPALQSYTLDDLLTKALGYDPYARLNINKKEMQKAKWDIPVIPPKQLEYGSLDVLHLLTLYNAIKDHKQDFSYLLDMLSLREALDWQNNGMYVDEDRLQEMYQSNLNEIAKIGLKINCNSWKQVRPYIGSEMSDGLGLTTLMLQGNERAGKVLHTRKLAKLNSFLDKFDTNDNLIHGVFGPYARSGRYTCDTQNLQQLPRKTKPIFRSKPNRFMLYSDFSQLELRGIAAITGDPRMVETYRSGGDIHNLVRDSLNITRQIAKTVNFNALYGGGAKMLRSILIKDAEILMDFNDVARELRRWKNLFYGVKSWQERGIRDFNGGRLGSTACGRRYRGRMMTDQLNIENQGTGSEVAKLAMHYMYNDLKANDCHIMNFIHDSYIIDAPFDETVHKTVAAQMAEAMQEAWFEVIKQVLVKDIPMPVKILGGYHWGDIEEGSYTFKYEVK